MRNIPTRRLFSLMNAFCVSLSLCSVLYSQSVTDSQVPSPVLQTIEELESDLDSLMNEISVPGAAVAIVSPEATLWIKTLGFGNLETGERVTENTHF